MSKKVTYTATYTSTPPSRREKLGWFVDEILEFVREVGSEEDAIHNLKLTMKQYEKRKTGWQRIKGLFK